MSQATVILYEVYDKRALHEPLAGLPLLDRDRDVKKAVRSARSWGGVVFKLRARILQAHPLRREVVVAQLIFVHTPRPPRPEPRDKVTIRQLRGQLLRFRRKQPFRGRR